MKSELKYKIYNKKDREFVSTGVVTGNNDGDVLLRSTGVLDKDGDEIFQGHILKVEIDIANKFYYDVAEVVYGVFTIGVEDYIEDIKTVGFALRSTKGNGCKGLDPSNRLNIKIIGNKFDNPELL